MTCGKVLESLAHSDLRVVKKASKSSKRGMKRSTSARAHGVFPCDRCGRSYVRKDSLQRHLQWECGKEPTFQCPYCPQRCKRKAHQIRHIRRQHSDMIDVVDTKEHSSDEDSKSVTGWSMTSDEVVTGLDPPADFRVKIESKGMKKRKTTRARGKFPCERCGRSYIRKDSLRRHLQWECGKEPTFQCPYCSQRCKRKAHHIRHIRRQHSDMIGFVNVEVKSEITDVTNG